jgi:hypothetical protein
MMMRAVALLVALALALPAAAWAQGKMSFSGTWVFNRAKSDPPPGGAGGGGGGRAAAVTAALAAPSTLYIKQTETELAIQGEATYRLDGRESVNKLPNGQSNTKASWDGAKLVLAMTQSLTTVEGKVDIQMKELWSLDAGVLMIERTVIGPEGPSTRKLIYTLLKAS